MDRGVMDDVPGIESRLQAYCVKRKIGKGSYGEVFLVTTRDGKKKVSMRLFLKGAHHCCL